LNAPTQPKTPTNVFTGESATGGYDFANVMQTAIDRLNTINPLTNTRQLLIKHLFDSSLSPEEMKSLPSEYQDMINTGDRKELEMGIRLLNDNISGRMGSMDESVQFLTNLYTKGQTDLETKKQNAIDNVFKFANIYGSNTKSVLGNLYSSTQLENLKNLGIDIDTLSATATLAEKKALEAEKPSYQYFTDNEGNVTQFNETTGVLTDIGQVSKPATGTVTPEAKRSDALNNYTLVNEILQSKGLPQLTGKAQVGGIWGLGNLVTSAYTKLAMNNMKQLNAVVSLANRQLLKGSGSISNFEAQMLSDASSNLGITPKGTTNLTEDMLKKQLAKIRGAFANAAGMEAPIIYTMPDGTTKETTASREEIEALLLAGCAIDYIEELSQ